MSRARSYKQELTVGALVVVAFLLATWMSIQAGASRAVGDAIVVTATFDDAAGLVKDGAVKLAGVRVGGVRALRVERDRAVAELVIDGQAGIRADAVARIRARSLLGEKYVDIDPGTVGGAPLLAGAAITTAPSTDLEDLMAAIGPLLRNVDPDDVATLVRAAAKIAESAEADVPALLSDAKALLAKLQEAAEIAPSLKRDVPALLDELRATVRKLDATLGRADGLLQKGDAVADGANRAISEVEPTLAELRAMVAELKPGIDDLAKALGESDELVVDLRTIAANLKGLDEESIRKLLREDGVLVRVRPPKE